MNWLFQTHENDFLRGVQVLRIFGRAALSFETYNTAEKRTTDYASYGIDISVTLYDELADCGLHIGISVGTETIYIGMLHPWHD